MRMIVTLRLKGDGRHNSLFPYRESSRTLLLTITVLGGGHGNDSSPEGNDAGEGAAAVPVRLGGGRPVARAHGAVHGGQHQPAGRGGGGAGGAARVPDRGGRRAARRLHVRPAVPVLPALRVGVRVRGGDARAADGGHRGLGARGDLRVLRGDDGGRGG